MVSRGCNPPPPSLRSGYSPHRSLRSLGGKTASLRVIGTEYGEHRAFGRDQLSGVLDRGGLAVPGVPIKPPRRFRPGPGVGDVGGGCLPTRRPGESDGASSQVSSGSHRRQGVGRSHGRQGATVGRGAGPGAAGPAATVALWHRSGARTGQGHLGGDVASRYRSPGTALVVAATHERLSRRTPRSSVPGTVLSTARSHPGRRRGHHRCHTPSCQRCAGGSDRGGGGGDYGLMAPDKASGGDV